MDTLISSGMARHQAEVQNANAPITGEDQELEELLKSITLTIKVVGCGGGGSNTITRLMEEGVRGAELIACNTDAVHLRQVHANRKILLGRNLTRGLGAGAIPQVGEKSANEASSELKKVVEKADIVFITCGLGGGTGTGAAPVVAQLAKETGALTIVFATKPFAAEGKARQDNAEHGLNRLRAVADTVVTIPNDKLLEMVPNLPINAAFKIVDELLNHSIKGLIEMVTKPGLVNLDYNDLRTIMQHAGIAVVGIGESSEKNGRAKQAVEDAIQSPLLEYDVSQASGVLVKVTGGPDMTLQEAQEVAALIGSKVQPGARIIWGASVEPEYQGKISVMIVLTGVTGEELTGARSEEFASVEGTRVGLDAVH
jgi:cell division protein FtsZ